MINLVKVKKALSECHLTAGLQFDFYKDCNDRYLLDRAFEELTRLRKGDIGDVNLIVQLLAIYKAKKNESVQTEQQRPGS